MNTIDAVRVWKLRIYYRDGIPARLAARLAGVNKRTASLYFSSFRQQYGPALCPCGRYSNHRGWCTWRVNQSPRRQELLKMWGKSVPTYADPLYGVVVSPRIDGEASHLCACGCALPTGKGKKFRKHHETDIERSEAEWIAIARRTMVDIGKLTNPKPSSL